MFFERGKQNDLEARLRSHMYPTSWPSDSKVVREEAAIALGLSGMLCPQGELGFTHSREGKKTSRREAEEKAIFLTTV